MWYQLNNAVCTEGNQEKYISFPELYHPSKISCVSVLFVNTWRWEIFVSISDCKVAYALILVQYLVLPDNAEITSQCSTIAVFISWYDKSGLKLRASEASQATCGTAIDVPSEYVYHVLCRVLKISSPGAAIDIPVP